MRALRVYTCVSVNHQIISAIRAGIPDELRGQLWKGFSGAVELQRCANLKRAVRRPSKTLSFRVRDTKESETEAQTTLFEKFAAPITFEDENSPDNRMLYARLSALALRDAAHSVVHDSDLALPTRLERIESDSSMQSGSQSERTDRESFLTPRSATGHDDNTEDDDADTAAAPRNTLKQLVKGRLGDYVYPSDAPSAEWELAARRRVLIATSRYKCVPLLSRVGVCEGANATCGVKLTVSRRVMLAASPFSHPCPWRVSCLLLAYMEEESAFWVINRYEALQCGDRACGENQH